MTARASPQQIYYSLGQTLTLTASTTNAGVSFNSWTGDASGTSNPLTLLMNTNKVVVANFGSVPTVTVSPPSQTVLIGSNAMLQANAMGLGPLSYQWLYGGGPIGGATNSIYTIADAQPANSGSYSVIVSNSYGAVTSAVATVTVVIPAEITMQPTNMLLVAGSVLDLSLSVTGTPPISVQWYDSSGLIPGATNTAFVLSPVQITNADSYYAIVTNLYGSATSQVANVIVYIPVSIAVGPQSQIVPARSTAVFTVQAGGYPTPSYQWTFAGTNLPGATSSALTIPNVQLSNLGNYAVLVSNPYSSMLSSTATLSMSPSIIMAYNGATAVWGRGAVLSVGAIGSGPLSYQWYDNGDAIDSATNSTLTFPTVQLTNGGYYCVVISSPFGSITNCAQLVVNSANMDLGMYAGINIGGVAGYTYIIQGSYNLQDTNAWLTLTNLTLQQDQELWVDTSTNALRSVQRYYRILPGP